MVNGRKEMDYCEITSHLDAREILRYLNSIGINNISGEILKYFITDLKKLIKYDLQQQQNSKQNYEQSGPERLHSASTFSSRSRSKAHGEHIVCSRECPRIKVHIRGSYSSPNLRPGATDEPKDDKQYKRACSCVRITRPETAITNRKESTVTTGCSNLIRVPKKPIRKKCDPVSLYHYYTSLWSKYKSNVPGENDWAELRWNIRQKLVEGSDVPVVKVPVAKDKNLLQAKK